MSNYRIALKVAQQYGGKMAMFDEMEKQREQTEKKIHKHNTLFDMGQLSYITEQKLNEAREIVKYNGKRMTDDEFKIFTNGFWSIPISRAKDYVKSKVSTKNKEKYDMEIGYWFGEMGFGDLPDEFSNNENCIKGLGKALGYSGATVGQLPAKFVGKKAFLLGYRSGIQIKANQINESKKGR